jgi:hypothetical protein
MAGFVTVSSVLDVRNRAWIKASDERAAFLAWVRE